MKKLLSALTAVVIALSFCSCGILRPLGQSDTDTAAPDAAQTSAVPDSAQGTGAVSYTHLDVYKRQVRGGFICLDNGIMLMYNII